MPYCDSKTHLSLGKRNPVHRRLLKGPISGSSSGSASLPASPSQFPSDIIEEHSTLQLRDSAGFSPAYLLSINTPDTLLFSCSLVRFLNFIAIYHAVFAVPQRGKHLHVKLSKLLIMYIGFLLYFIMISIT